MRSVSFALLLMAGASSCEAVVEFVQKPDAIIVMVNGKQFTQLRFGKDQAGPRLYPLATASGKPLTGPSSSDGIWVGHQSVNGVDFFDAGPRKPAGRVVLKQVTATVSGHEGILSFVTDWVQPDGTAVIREYRALRFYDDPQDTRTVDVEFLLHANQKLELADTTGSILGLALSKDFLHSRDAVRKNYLGATAVSGRQSTWLTFEGELGGERIGVTIMDHPDNYNFPTRWRVTPEGAVHTAAFAGRTSSPPMAALPAAIKDMGVTLEAGQEMFFRYRILIHPPAIDRHSCWKQFAVTPPSGFTVPVPPSAQ